MLFRKRHQSDLRKLLAEEQERIRVIVEEMVDTVELDVEWACGCSPDFPGLHYGCRRHGVQ